MKKKDYDWMQRTVKLKWTEAGASGSPYSDSVYIDVAQCLSMLNRKLVRQGQLFRIRNFTVYTNDTSPNATYKVGVIPTNWVTRNAWVKGKAMWDKLNATVSEDIGQTSIYPKYHDFKVRMDYNHLTEDTSGSADESLLPVDFNDAAMETGEWVYSKLTDSGSTPQTYPIHFLGDHEGTDGSWDSIGLIQSYAESRTYPKTDITAGDQAASVDLKTGPYARLFGDDAQVTTAVGALLDDNDRAPYSLIEYVGGKTLSAGQVVGFSRLQTLSQVTGSGTAGMGARTFVAPCGLIRLEIDAESSTAGMQPVHITFDVDILGPMDM